MPLFGSVRLAKRYDLATHVHQGHERDGSEGAGRRTGMQPRHPHPGAARLRQVWILNRWHVATRHTAIFLC